MLDNVSVLSFTHYLQGPSATQILADLGADVIKVEPLHGAYERHWAGAEAFLDEESVFFLLAGRNQRSLSVDLRAQEGKEIIWQLLDETDVLIENFRPGVMDRLGFGFEEVARANPALVYCSLTGFGATGPYKDRPGQDLLIQAMSGLAAQSGRAQDPPTAVGSAMVDQHAAVLGALGVLAALYSRTTSGRGTRVETDLLSAALDLQVEPLTYHLNGARLYDRSSTGLATRFHQAPYGVFATADGHLCLSLTTAGQLADAFRDDSLRDYAREDQFRRREELNAKIAAHLRREPTDHWRRVLEDAGVWHAPVNDYEDVLSDPQVAHKRPVVSFEHPSAGEVRVLSHPVRYDGAAPPVRRVPPALGEHTAEVLTDLGYGDADVERLSAAGVVRAPQAAGR